MASVWEGIIIGGAGGAVAGITVYAIQHAHNLCRDCADTRKVERWISKNTEDKPGARFRTTRAIASWNNLTEDRIRYLCSHSKKIFLSTGEKEDLWSTIQREKDFPDEHLST